MKKLLLALAFIVLAVSSYSQQKFMLGVLDPPRLTYTYPWVFDSGNKTSSDIANINSLKTVSDCYFNLILNGMLSTPNNSWSGNSQDISDAKQQRDYYLNIVNECQLPNGENLKTMVTDAIIWQDHCYNSIAAQLFPATLSANPNIYGIYVFDEPHFYDSQNRFDLVSKGTWNTFFTSPTSSFNKPCFVNLHPFDRSVHTISQYNQYLADYTTQFSNSPFLCFDLYPFLKNNIFDKTYFWHLSVMKAKALETPVRDLWATVHTMNNDGNRENENEEQLRFMAFSPIAYGAKGLQYWAFDYSVTPYEGLLQTPIKYNQVKKINKYISDVVGDIVVNNKNIATLHKNAIPSTIPATSNIPDVIVNDFPSFEKLENYEGIIKDVSADDILVGVFSNQPTACSVFPNPGADTYLFIINKATYELTDLQDVVVTLRGNHTDSVYLYQSLDECSTSSICNIPSQVATTYNASLDITTFTIPVLKRGDGRMVRINAKIPKLTIKYKPLTPGNNFSIYPNPVLPAGNYTYNWFVNGELQTITTSPFPFTANPCEESSVNLIVSYNDCSFNNITIESELSNTLVFPAIPPTSSEFPNPCNEMLAGNLARVKTEANKQLQKPAFSIYPNPNKGVFNINVHGYASGISTISVVDIQGKVVWKQYINKGQQKINITEPLAKGVYIVQLINSETSKVETQKLVVQ